jgi:hypothetical protein
MDAAQMNEVECAKMQKDILRLDQNVNGVLGILTAVTKIEMSVVEILDTLKGSERHGDIGLVKRVENLEHSTITWKAVAGLAAFVSVIMGAGAGALTVFAHLAFK